MKTNTYLDNIKTRNMFKWSIIILKKTTLVVE